VKAFVEALTRRLHETGIHGRFTPGYSLGAVILLLYPRGDELFFLAIERPRDMSRHPGQVGLPGGGVCLPEESPEAAALRESEEEVGIPRDSIQLLGVLGYFPIPVSGWDVVACIGWWDGQDPLRRQETEVEVILRVSIEDMVDQHNRKFAGQTYGPPEYPEYFHEQDGQRHRIWGCTARVLHRFFETIYLPVIQAPPS